MPNSKQELCSKCGREKHPDGSCHICIYQAWQEAIRKCRVCGEEKETFIFNNYRRVCLSCFDEDPMRSFRELTYVSPKAVKPLRWNDPQRVKPVRCKVAFDAADHIRAHGLGVQL